MASSMAAMTGRERKVWLCGMTTSPRHPHVRRKTIYFCGIVEIAAEGKKRRERREVTPDCTRSDEIYLGALKHPADPQAACPDSTTVCPYGLRLNLGRRPSSLVTDTYSKQAKRHSSTSWYGL